MLLAQLLDRLVNAQSVPTPTVNFNCGCPLGDPTCFDLCPASSLTDIAAAFATEGYYAQADIIWNLQNTALGHWAPLLYIMGALMGMIALVLGAPPRNYLWFFLGPAIYSFLIDTTTPASGVAWRVGELPADQTQVWRIAEPGLANKPYVSRMGIEVYNNRPPSAPAEVAMVFLWFDDLISSTVQWMVQWTGVHQQVAAQSSSDTNLPEFTGSGAGSGVLQHQANQGSILSTLKWQYLEQITGAKLHSADLRDAFATFMASECGDALSKSVDHAKFTAVANARGRELNPAEPLTIFAHPPNTIPGTPAAYMQVMNNLKQVVIPTPRSLKDFLDTPANDGGSFTNFNTFFRNKLYKTSYGSAGSGGVPNNQDRTFYDRLTCAQYLWVLMHGFRWEAAHIFAQLKKAAPNGMSEALVYQLLYGWDIKNTSGAPLNSAEQEEFIKNLILVYLMRNEMAMAPQMVNRRYASSTEAQNYVEQYVKTVGAQNKYGELYSWALMVPYIQGILLYFLAAAYPFACVMIVFPGFHKTIFTWMSFWAWVKLWDVGFAFVGSLDRSLWAMIGSSSDNAHISKFILKMIPWGSTSITYPLNSSGGESLLPVIENVAQDPGIASSVAGQGAIPLANGGMQAFHASLMTLDSVMALGANLDLDVANGYYVFLMGALYLAVPVVVGQLVLGAKAGSANMIGSMFGGFATQSGQQAGAGYLSSFQNRALENFGAVQQTGYAKGLRQSGLADEAISAGNKQLLNSTRASAMGTINEGIGAQAAALGRTYDSEMASNDAMAKMATASAHGVSAAFGMLGVGGIGPSAAMRPSGGSPSSGGSLLEGGLAKATDGLFKRGPHALHASANALHAAAAHENFHLGNAKMGVANAADAARLDNSAAAFGFSSAASGHGLQSSRAGAAANFEAQQAEWKAKRDFGNHMAGWTGAMGVFAGTFSPQQKPVGLEGMAYDGMLNSYNSDGSASRDTQAAARYAAEDGGFFNQRSGDRTALQSSVNSFANGASVNDAYRPSDLASNPISQRAKELSGQWMAASESGQTPEGIEYRGGNQSRTSTPNFGGGRDAVAKVGAPLPETK